jgi:mRNA interferase RelE/StbE
LVWKIEYTDKAISQLGKLDKYNARRIMDYMDHRVATSDDPYSFGKVLTGPLGGLWRYRIGNYRAICEIEEVALTILVLEVGHRKDIYR